jgi:hypothetical protein
MSSSILQTHFLILVYSIHKTVDWLKDVDMKITFQHITAHPPHESYLVAAATDLQSFLSRRPALLCWNVPEVDDEQPPLFCGLIHWLPLVMRQKTYLGPVTKYEASQCPGLHFLHYLKHCAQTILCKITHDQLLTTCLHAVWKDCFVKAVLQMQGVFHNLHA